MEQGRRGMEREGHAAWRERRGGTGVEREEREGTWVRRVGREERSHEWREKAWACGCGLIYFNYNLFAMR